MRKRILIIFGSGLLLIAAFLAGSRTSTVAHAGEPAQSAGDKSYAPTQGVVPKSYGRIVAAIADNIGTGLVFEDAEGVIRFVSITGMKEGELARYDTVPTRGGIPKSYGHLVTAVVNN
ncbi:MAG: hypothetical protein WBW01_15940, partial [Terriglobales bacterium]